jgi:hypothetical protein
LRISFLTICEERHDPVQHDASRAQRNDNGDTQGDETSRQLHDLPVPRIEREPSH